MPVGPTSMPRKLNTGPTNSRPRTSSTRMTAMKEKQTTATQHSTLCQTASTRAPQQAAR